MNKVCWSCRNQVAALTSASLLVSFLEGSLGFCFILLIFVRFFSPLTSQAPDDAFSSAGKLLQVSSGRDGAGPRPCPSAQGAAFGVKPLLFGVVQGGETPSRSPTHGAFAAAWCHGLAWGPDRPCVCLLGLCSQGGDTCWDPHQAIFRRYHLRIGIVLFPPPLPAWAQLRGHVVTHRWYRSRDGAVRGGPASSNTEAEAVPMLGWAQTGKGN